MIPETQTIEILKERFPGLAMCDDKSAMTNMTLLSGHIRQLLNDEKYDEAKILLAVVDDLYAHGCPTVKTGFENIVFYNLGTWFAALPDRRKLYHLVPDQIHQLMIQQFISSGI